MQRLSGGCLLLTVHTAKSLKKLKVLLLENPECGQGTSSNTGKGAVKSTARPFDKEMCDIAPTPVASQVIDVRKNDAAQPKNLFGNG